MLKLFDKLLFPFCWKLLGSSIIATQSMDSAFNKNQSELGIDILSVFF
jgi:hypothetical protein